MLRYADLAWQGSGANDNGRLASARARPVSEDSRDSGRRGGAATTSVATPEPTGTADADSVFTVIEVDIEVKRLPGSAAPKYPPPLVERGIEGSVIVQFIVDTTGTAEVESFDVISATDAAFAQSVRDALAGMRFSAARIGAQRVRQLVQLPFTFRLAKPDTASGKTTPH